MTTALDLLILNSYYNRLVAHFLDQKLFKSTSSKGNKTPFKSAPKLATQREYKEKQFVLNLQA